MLVVAAHPRAVERRALVAAEDGWTLSEGFEPRAAAWDLSSLRLCCVGTVETDEDVSAVIVTATRGAAVVVACADDHRRARLADDLGRVGTVTTVEGGAGVADRLPDEQHRLLTLLGEGASMAEAARELLISMRTGERRLAAARKALGVRTTAEAVALVAGD